MFFIGGKRNYLNLNANFYVSSLCSCEKVSRDSLLPFQSFTFAKFDFEFSLQLRTKMIKISGVARNLAWGVQSDNFGLKALLI
jgi:hypothetical protein